MRQGNRESAIIPYPEKHLQRAAAMARCRVRGSVHYTYDLRGRRVDAGYWLQENHWGTVFDWEANYVYTTAWR